MSTDTSYASHKLHEPLRSEKASNQHPRSATPRIPKWRKYVHLYLPVVVSFILIISAEKLSQRIGFSRFDRGNTLPIILASAIPTYLLGSTVYPSNRPDPTPEQSIRFTRRKDIYRALVLLTYGRLFGTSFNFIFYGLDVLCSFAMDTVIGERPIGTPQRRSEFIVACLWVVGSWILHQVIPFSTPIVGLFLGIAERTLWRTAYVALVDDVVGVLARPNVRRVRGKVTLVLVQSFIITSFNYLARSFLKRLVSEAMLQKEGISAEA
ncbi:hypothetical protein T440DRAFT_554171 [Plenodomus tracheiphilus IPT5]|uniref:Uncharacterized protein n=1 Tax=Plenodomus tracheiphilus IPT5 TaxID=1408161 RepID=A0A6A7B933_9PLEO|nr:hypothetical protein T440DRAFT_554171 [Plenodomus tracheiphilus IPT5]